MVLVALVAFGLAAGAAWMGFRILQDPNFTAAPGTADDGIRGQQKIYDLARVWPSRGRGRTRQVVLSEPELNGFLSRHLGEAAGMPIAAGAVRLLGDGMVEFTGQVQVRHMLVSVPLVPVAQFLPASWLERRIWLHLGARASLEVGAMRGQRRYLRLDVERFALGRQPLPEPLLRLLVTPGALSLLRWRVPDGVEAITIESGAVVIRIAS